MSASPLGPPPPPDRGQDAQRRARARRVEQRSRIGAFCALAQFMLSLALGAWVLAGAGDASGELPLFGAIALCFALFGAYAVTQSARLVAALVGLAVVAPSLLKRLTSAPRPPSARGPGDASLAPAVSWFSVALHTGVMLALALALAVAFAWASGAVDFADVWWRFVLAVFALAPFTRRALEVLWPEG